MGSLITFHFADEIIVAVAELGVYVEKRDIEDRQLSPRDMKFPRGETHRIFEYRFDY